MGLVIQRIEPNGRVYRDGRLKAGDRIIEINQTSLIGVDFVRAQEILRDALKHTDIHNEDENDELNLKIIRNSQLDVKNFNTDQQIPILNNNNNKNNFDEEEFYTNNEIVLNEYSEALRENEREFNERPIEIEFLNHDDKENNNNKDHEGGQDNDVNDHKNYFNNNTNAQPATLSSYSSINMSALNTKKLGKKVTVQLIKGPQGLGFKLAARDNCTLGEFSPIYIKNILPKGAAITDGRLQRGDRLIKVNKMDMTQKTLHEAVNILRDTKLGSSVELVVSRQVLPAQTSQGSLVNTMTSLNSASKLPRELNTDEANFANLNAPYADIEVPVEAQVNEESKINTKANNRRQLLTFEIALNDTGSAGLGVSVKGKTKRTEENDCSIDLGIFVKTVINGGAASKDGRLKPNDQLININGFSLLGKSNEEAMLILREAMQVESRPGHIELSVSRKLRMSTTTLCSNVINKAIQEQNLEPPQQQQQQVVRIINHHSVKPASTYEASEELGGNNSNRFNRDAPSRRSMSEKRTKIGSGGAAAAAAAISGPNGLPPRQNLTSQTKSIAQGENGTDSNANPKRSHTLSGIYNKNHYQTKPLLANTTNNSNNQSDAAANRDHFKRIGSFDSVISNNANFSKSNFISIRIKTIF